MIKDLNLIYRYFSHYMRNFTAVITTSVALVHDDMLSADERVDISSYMSDVSALLCVFDKGLEACFSYIQGVLPSGGDDFCLVESVSDFFKKNKNYFKEYGVVLTCDEGRFKLATDRDVVIPLVCVILHEAAVQSGGHIEIECSSYSISGRSGARFNIPKIWMVFSEILADNGINFSYTDSGVLLERL